MFTPSNLCRPLFLVIFFVAIVLFVLWLFSNEDMAARERLEGSAPRNSGCILLMLNGTPRARAV
jgi:hypothetical protein